MQIEALKEAYEELKEMYGEENIISAGLRRRDNAPSTKDFVPPTKAGNRRKT